MSSELDEKPTTAMHAFHQSGGNESTARHTCTKERSLRVLWITDVDVHGGGQRVRGVGEGEGHCVTLLVHQIPKFAKVVQRRRNEAKGLPGIRVSNEYAAAHTAIELDEMSSPMNIGQTHVKGASADRFAGRAP